MFDDLNHLNFHIKLNLGLPGSSLRNINPNKHFRKSKTKKKISNVNELNSKCFCCCFFFIIFFKKISCYWEQNKNKENLSSKNEIVIVILPVIVIVLDNDYSQNHFHYV